MLFYEQVIVRVGPELVTYQVNYVKLKPLLKTMTILVLTFMVSVGFLFVCLFGFLVFL